MHIPIIYVETMKELGYACGIDINAAVAALLI
jgi:ribosomal protein L7Ae-like RNA K-turn-binding protein